MSGGKTRDDSGSTIERLTKVCETLVETSTASNKKMDDLTNKVGYLAEVIARSEQRHEKTTDDIQRIEVNTQSLGKDFKIYKQANDDRTVQNEKQILLHGESIRRITDQQEKTQAKKDKIFYSVAVVVIGAIILHFIGLK